VTREKDETGKRYGRWTVLARAGFYHSQARAKHGVVWLCLCECGRRRMVRGDALRRRGGTRSCACCAAKDRWSKRVAS
jgi:hypothetical protein